MLFLPFLNFQFLIYLWHDNHSLNHHLLRKYMPDDGATKVSKITPPKPLDHTNKKVIPNKMFGTDKGKHKMLKKDTQPKLCKRVFWRKEFPQLSEEG